MPVVLSVNEMRIVRDVQSPFISVSLVLSDPEDYALFPRDTGTIQSSFVVGYYGTNYEFVVDNTTATKSQTRTTINFVSEIRGLSRLVRLGPERAGIIDQIFDTPRFARSIVEELLGVTVTWEVLDWAIPANRFGVSAQSPLDAAKQVVGAIGAVMGSNPDGSFFVRSQYPVNLWELDTAPVDITLTAGDIIHISEEINADPHWRTVTVMDSRPDAFKDTIEFEPDETNSLKGVLHVYPNPFRTTVVLTTTRTGVTLSGGTVKTRTETQEDIEFVGGRATLRWPADTVGSVVYKNVNLGGVTAIGSDVDAAVQGQSLADITYNVKSIDYNTTANAPKAAQFVLEDV